ncbi:MAG: hypothetical protein ACPGVO_03930 [Spirulinaceae cyanobacterium]
MNQFSQCLFFVEERRGKVSRWGSDPKLKHYFLRLSQDQPDFELVDWLVYFVERVVNPADTYETSDRHFALRHLWCFYQLEFYFVARKWWHNCRSPQQLYSWEALFDAIAEPFVDLNQAQDCLKNFDPKIATKSYINTLCYRRGKDWLQKKFGADFMRKLPFVQSWETAANANGDWDSANQTQAESQAIADQELRQDHTQQKQQQERIYQVVAQQLAALDEQRSRGIYLKPTPLTLAEVMRIGYGINIGQSGTAAVLQANQYAIDQSKLSRHFKTFKVSLFLHCLDAFSQELQELKEILNEQCLEPEESELFEELAQKQHKTLDSLLKNYYQDWIFDHVVQVAHSAQISSQLHHWLIELLQLWFREQLKLQFELGDLPPATYKKMQQVLADWKEKLHAQTA